MPKSQVYTVSTTASVVVAANIAYQAVYLHSASGTLYIGGADLTTDNGYKLDNGDKLTIMVGDQEALYAITTNGTATLYVLSQIN
jgi:hypothetical protein